ncbi:MAG: exodeoxyribonuclease VII small subunit [Acidimicrobiales bacterium]|nr:exodeoxyribonuclease VII small subunit [Acidimicrobiales bacterium]
MNTSITGEQDDESISYADAIVEVEQILTELEGGDIDVDKLAEQVKRASQLLHLCRERLSIVHVDVEKLISGLEEPSSGLPADE